MRWFCNSFLIQVQVLCPKSFKRIANFYCVQVGAAFKNTAVTMRTLFTDWPSFSFSAFLLRSSFSSAWANDADTLWGILVLVSSELHAHIQNVPQNTETKIEKHKIRPCRLRHGAVNGFILRSAAGNFILTSECMHVQKQLLECANTRACEQTHPCHFLYANEEPTSTYLGLSFCSVSADLGPW